MHPRCHSPWGKDASFCSYIVQATIVNAKPLLTIFFFIRTAGKSQGLLLSSITLSANRDATCLYISSRLSGEVQ